MPGSIAATPVEGPIDVEEGMPIDLPLVFYYGHQTPTENPELYRALVERMSSILDKRVRPLPLECTDIPCKLSDLRTTTPERSKHVARSSEVSRACMQENVDVQAAGLIINTMGFIEGLGYELLLHAIGALKADVVLVLGQERLFNQLRTHLRFVQTTLPALLKSASIGRGAVPCGSTVPYQTRDIIVLSRSSAAISTHT